MVEREVGRMIQRITLAIVRGLREVLVRRVLRNWVIVVVGERERRWIVQSGILIETCTVW